MDAFKVIEHVEFRALANAADDTERFLELTRTRPPVLALLEAKDGPMLLARIRLLAQKKTDPKFLHPDDVACAVYLDVLFRLKQDRLVQQAWALCQPHADRMYWTNAIARSLNQRAAGLASTTPAAAPAETAPSDAPVVPPPPAAVTPDAFAAAFYDVYNAAVQELAPANQKPPPRPAWTALPAEHPTRKVIQTACDRLLARLDAVPHVTLQADTDQKRDAIAQWLRDGKIAARLVLRDA
jgi:hypothetical protein